MNSFNKNDWKVTLQRGFLALSIAAGSVLYSCEQKQATNDADANSTQDAMETDNGAGAGFSTDTSGAASRPANDTTNTNQGVGPGVMSSPSSDTVGTQPAGTGSRNTGATADDKKQ